MTSFFLKLVDMSLSASWIVLAVIAARLVLRKAPKWMNCALWALVAVRLVCPFSLESTFSLIPEVNIPQEIHAAATEAQSGDVTANSPEALPEVRQEWSGDRGYGVILSSDSEVLAVKALKNPETTPSLYQILSIFWLVGLVLMAAYAVSSYLHIRKKVQVSIDLGDGVYICDYIDTPFILGIRKPRIYLASAMDPRDAAHVLAHERAHLNRRDHWWKPLGFTLLSLHWFNPLLWVAYILLCRDIELACDERVIQSMEKSEKKAYSEALLKCSVPRHMIMACPLAFGEVGVKQRVKSVLHYRKPGFWILLVSVIAIVVVAVCFLTDPETPTLANIMEIREEEVTAIRVWSRKGRLRMETEEEIGEFLEFLDTIEYDPKPASNEAIEGDMDENHWGYDFVEIYYGTQIEQILLNYDRTLVWTRDAEGVNSLPYNLTGRETVVEYLQQEVTPVLGRYITADSFTSGEDAHEWLSKIHLDALKTARLTVVHEDQTLSTAYLTHGKAGALLSILNALPEDAIGEMTVDKEFTYEDLRYFSGTYVSPTGAYILLTDDANDLTCVLRQYDGKLELVIAKGTARLDESPYDRSLPAKIWTLNAPSLQEYLTELESDPPSIMTFTGSRYDFREELAVLSDGDTTISAYVENSWDYEFIQPEDEEDFFGFRVRPKEETEGWICFGWWGSNFTPAENEEETQTNMYGFHYIYTQGALEHDGVSHNYLRCHCFHGDFVVLYEGSDAWIEDYRDDFAFYEMIVTIHCATHLQLTEMSNDVAETLRDTGYYDWDSIAREIGVDSMTLFDPQRYHDRLFVGCQHEGGYHIACFEMQEDGSYAYMGVRKPESQFVAPGDTRMVPMIKYEAEEEQYNLYVFDDESITGLHFGGGYWGYVPLEQSPSLVLLDMTNWSDGMSLFTMRTDDPEQIAMSITTQNGIRYLDFGAPGFHDTVYVYGNNLEYFDGINRPGQYQLENQEIIELIEILTGIPPANITHKFMPEHDDLAVNLTLYVDDGERFDWERTILSFYYSDGKVLLYMYPANSDQTYYFQIESAALNEFLLDKIDDSRKEADLNTYCQEPMEYSHADVSFRLKRPLGFEYEIVEYTDEESPFGIRVRPMGEDGWLFFSYWPGGFEEEETVHYQKMDILFNTDGVQTKFPCRYAYTQEGLSEEEYRYEWKYILFPYAGNYVLLNEGAESWLEEYRAVPLNMVELDSFGNGDWLEKES